MTRLDLNLVKFENEELGDTVVTKFYYRGLPCNIAVIDHPSAKKTAAYRAMLTDLEHVIASLNLAIEARKELPPESNINQFDINNKDHLILSNIHHSSVVMYAKCFTSAEGRTIKLERSNLEKSLGTSMLTTHDRVISLRNQWAAHGGHDDSEATKALMVFDPTKKTLPSLLYFSSHRYIPDTEFTISFIELCKEVENEINKQIFASEAKFLKKPFTMDYLDSLFRISASHLEVHKISVHPKVSGNGGSA